MKPKRFVCILERRRLWQIKLADCCPLLQNYIRKHCTVRYRAKTKHGIGVCLFYSKCIIVKAI